jgi:uncharacterized phage protein (TIGR01671 family)
MLIKEGTKMREILFRGKMGSLNLFVAGNYFYSEKENTHYIIGDSKNYGFQKIAVIPETIGQFTGLKDKNGVMIFEGDILTSDNYPFKDEKKMSYNAEVCFFENCATFGYCLHCVNIDKRGISDGICELFEDYNHFEVIGNIHDNPDLLDDNNATI